MSIRHVSIRRVIRHVARGVRRLSRRDARHVYTPSSGRGARRIAGRAEINGRDTCARCNSRMTCYHLPYMVGAAGPALRRRAAPRALHFPRARRDRNLGAEIAISAMNPHQNLSHTIRGRTTEIAISVI